MSKKQTKTDKRSLWKKRKSTTPKDREDRRTKGFTKTERRAHLRFAAMAAALGLPPCPEV